MNEKKKMDYIALLEMTVTTLERLLCETPWSVRTVHNAFEHPDDSLLFLSDLRAIADGDHEWVMLEMVTKSVSGDA